MEANLKIMVLKYFVLNNGKYLIGKIDVKSMKQFLWAHHIPKHIEFSINHH